jgi:hypothetical protein
MLGREHPECKAAAIRVRDIVRTSVAATAGPEDFAVKYAAARAAGARNIVDIAPALEGWTVAVERALEDGLLDADEEKRALQVASVVGIGQQNAGPLWLKLAKAKILRQVTAGVVPEVAAITGYHANLLKKERPVWLFNGAGFYEERTQRSFSGVSHGLSIRIMKGVYYRPSMFKGTPVETTKLVHVDNGGLLITSHHIYFLGTRKSFRVPYRKILAFEPYKDGLGVQRDAMTAKPQIFTVDDAWFAYNLVTNLARIGEDG